MVKALENIGDTSVVDSSTGTIYLCGHECFDPDKGGSAQLVHELHESPTIQQQDGDQAVVLASKAFRIRYAHGCLKDCKNGPRVLVDVNGKTYAAQARCLAQLEATIQDIIAPKAESEPQDEA